MAVPQPKAISCAFLHAVMAGPCSKFPNTATALPLGIMEERSSEIGRRYNWPCPGGPHDALHSISTRPQLAEGCQRNPVLFCGFMEDLVGHVKTGRVPDSGIEQGLHG
ncbi:hypothetical protein B0I37DRAFT_112105 [Chaetomium sp. MPI-CAGE-AT-0009]|nr:hypothetical protein B0I37DRAFT_112105 [Chaetomium sp. MPI-CAGE-AT-0009]